MPKLNTIHACLSVAVLSALITAGCTWVEPIEDAQIVYLVRAANTQGCERLGTTLSTVKDQIGWLNRSDTRVAAELLTLAQNAAVTMGGNSLVETAPPMDGSQQFIIYSCPDAGM